MSKKFLFLSIVYLLIFIPLSCNKSDISEENPTPDDPNYGYTDPIPDTTSFTALEVYYHGDDIGEATSDGWIFKFYTEMEIDPSGNPIGPGEIMQLLLNVPYEPTQEPVLSNLDGYYLSQSNSGDFSPYTFCYGYMDYIDLPNGRVERPDGTFYASISAGDTQMDVDMIDDGVVQFIPNLDGSYTIEGILVGKDCIKRYFTWTGSMEVNSEVEPQQGNSTLTSDLDLSHLTIAQMEDRNDCFFLQDNSYRCYLIYLAEDGIDFSSGRPAGSGDLLRLEILVPWECDVTEGIPSGSYPMVTRNPDTSIDRDQIVPYRSIPGLPDRFSYPYWGGTWYVEFADGMWGDNYARIDSGVVEVEHIEGEGYNIVCRFKDCQDVANNINTDIFLAEDNLKIVTY